jgi:hypothetical protein
MSGGLNLGWSIASTFMTTVIAAAGIVAGTFTPAKSTDKAVAASHMQICSANFPDRNLDCACVVKFLAERLPSDAVEIVLVAWGLSLKGEDHSGDKDSFNYKHGVLKIDQALRDFNRVRKLLFVKCPNSEPENEDFDF